MNLLDTGVNHEHIGQHGQPRQTHPPVATVDANVLSTYCVPGTRMTRVLLGAGTLFWRAKQIENSRHSEVPNSANAKSVPPDCLSRQR